MVWFHLSLLSAVSKAANQALTKTLTRDFPVLTIATFGQLAAGIFLLPLIIHSQLISIPTDLHFHKAAAVTISINIIAILLLIEAIRRSDLSYAIPFLGLTPVFTLFTGWALRGEIVDLQGIVGIIVVVIGTFGIDTKSIIDWATLGGRRIFKDKGVLLVIVVALLYSVSSVYDKTATLLSDPFTFVWYSAIIRSIALLLIWFMINHNATVSLKDNSFTFTPLHLLFFAGLGLTFTAEALFQMYALQTGLVAYVITIKRLSILVTSLVGMTIYKEVFSWTRLAGAFLIVFGATLIYLS